MPVLGQGVDTRICGSGVRGPVGLGVVNDAGKEFLNFLLLNEASICNTLFAKKHIHMQI